MEIAMLVRLNAPDVIGICGGTMTYAGVDEMGDHLWVYGIDDVESNIEVLSDYHMVRARYKDDIIYECSEIKSDDDLCFAIDKAIVKIEECYKRDGLFMGARE